ncbi:MAG: DUF4296 domain-containing protein [Bacteroidia bacterium]|nr:DUF4296 domain-containing protein [Bacteroidia bacterium]
MKKFLGLILILGLAAACQNETNKPDDVLAVDKMVNLLIDIHLAEARIEEQRFRNQDSAMMTYLALEEEVFARHQVDSATYKRSMAFYVSHMPLLDSIYQGVVDSLIYRENVLKSTKEQHPLVQNRIAYSQTSPHPQRACGQKPLWKSGKKKD